MSAATVRSDRTWDLDDLVGGPDAARRLGVTPSVVVNWRLRYTTLPAPLTHVSRGTPIWGRVETRHSRMVRAGLG